MSHKHLSRFVLESQTSFELHFSKQTFVLILGGALLLFEDEFIHVVSISFTALILTELIMVALTIRTWHWLMIIAEFASLAIYILSLIILKDFFGMTLKKFDQNCQWLTCLFSQMRNLSRLVDSCGAQPPSRPFPVSLSTSGNFCASVSHPPLIRN